jgi:DNA mismatch endonuclease (patch repair protein)
MTSELRHKIMSHIKSSGTSIEVLLCKALWREGIRYRKNLKTLPGKPDIVITKYKIAIFCDGEFWHGKNWDKTRDKIKNNRDFWVAKIDRNITRDNKNDKKLANMGWAVLHYWGNEINKKLSDCVSEIKETIYEIKNGIYNLDFYAAENIPEYDDEDDL